MKISALIGSTAIVFLTSGVACFADVTPEEVWENWKSAATLGGTTILSESEERDGDTLVITGVSMSSAADPAATADGKIGEIRLTDLGDGTVEITQSDSYSITVTTPAVDGVAPPVAQTTTVSISAPGAVTLVSGTVEEMSYDFDLPMIEASVVTAGDPADAVNVTVSAVNALGSYLVEGTEPMAISGTLAAESMAIALKGKDSADGTDVDMTAAIGAIDMAYDATVLDPETMADMAAALDAGFAFHFDTTYGATSFGLNVVTAGAPTAISGGVESGAIAIGMDATEFSYETGSEGLNLTISGAEIPFPEVKLSLGESGFGLTMPTTPTDEPAPFSFLAKLVDLSISEDIWGMLDPGAALSHDPATVILDGEGMAKLTSDLFAPDTMTAGAPPGELISFNLTQLLAKIAGAELSGNGAFTFDNTDLATFEGMPAPTGKIDLKVTGANMLIDTLISMGMVSEDDAMGARMMLSMFANPGPGADEFTSVLEFKDKGFYANGQRLQ